VQKNMPTSPKSSFENVGPTASSSSWASSESH
jgi:hypothetical protein